MKLTPKEAVKAMCVNCLGLNQFSAELVKDCEGNMALNGVCPLYPFRLGKRVSVKNFRTYCLYCVGGSKEWVSECPTKTCAIYPYRFGKNPALAGKGNTKALQKYRETSVGA